MSDILASFSFLSVSSAATLLSLAVLSASNSAIFELVAPTELSKTIRFHELPVSTAKHAPPLSPPLEKNKRPFTPGVGSGLLINPPPVVRLVPNTD